MARKRLVLLGLPVAAALAAAGVAIAAAGSSSQAVSASFSATTISNKHQATCSANGGDTLKVTVATYAGNASSTDARLDGTIRLRVRSIIDTATGLGRVDGVFGVKGSTGGARGQIHAAVSGGQAAGFAEGRAKNPGGRLVASFGSSFDPDAGFTAGSLGGSSSGAGAVLSGPVCKAAGLHVKAAVHLHARLKAHGR
jgi:hypothetical protein